MYALYNNLAKPTSYIFIEFCYKVTSNLINFVKEFSHCFLLHLSLIC